MFEIKIQISRIAYTHQPGFVEGQFTDARGVVHTIIEKTPIVSCENLWTDSTFPTCGAIRCEIIKEWIEDERKLIKVSTKKPDGVETTSGIHEFDMLPHQLRNTSEFNDLAVEYSLNIYKGCSHGCIYCSSRGEYYGITDFDNILFEDDVLRRFRHDLSKIKRCIVTTGGLSDPYNPMEQKYKMTRKALELINEFNFGVCVMTKSDMILRDTDILQDIKTHSYSNIAFSITCADDEMCQKIEPFAPLSSQRFAAIKELTRYGITAGVLLNPVLPYITDTEANVRGVVKKAKEAGAHYIYATMEVILEDSQREHFFVKADPLFPETKDRYIKTLGNSHLFRSPYEKDLRMVFAEECERQEIVFDIHVSRTITRDAKVFSSKLLNLCRKQQT